MRAAAFLKDERFAAKEATQATSRIVSEKLR